MKSLHPCVHIQSSKKIINNVLIQLLIPFYHMKSYIFTSRGKIPILFIVASDIPVAEESLCGYSKFYKSFG